MQNKMYFFRRLLMLIVLTIGIKEGTWARPVVNYDDWVPECNTSRTTYSGSITIEAEAGDELSLDYECNTYYSSYSDSYAISISSADISAVTLYSRSSASGFASGTKTYTITKDGTYTLSLSYYHYNSSTSYYAKATNIQLKKGGVEIKSGQTFDDWKPNTQSTNAGNKNTKSFTIDAKAGETLSIDYNAYLYYWSSSSSYNSDYYRDYMEITIDGVQELYKTYFSSNTRTYSGTYSHMFDSDGEHTVTLNYWRCNYNSSSSYYANFSNIHLYRIPSDEGGALYHVYSDGTAELYDGTSVKDEFEIPETIVYDGKEYMVESIGKEAFKGNTNLTYIYIPKTITNVGANAFQNCTALTDIDVYSKAKYGTGAFDGCTAISAVATKDAGTWASNTFVSATSNPVYYSKTIKIGKNLTSITIPSSITSLSAYAFYNAQNLRSVTFEDGATSIGQYAFYGCTNLQEVTMPGTIETIGSYAFSGCTELIAVTVGDGDGTLTMGTQVFAGAPVEDLILGKAWTTTATISSTDAPFYNRTGIHSITLGSMVTSIPSYAFYGCTGISSLEIPTSVTSIGSYAFNGCTGITTLKFNEGSADLTVDTYAFYGCSAVTSLSLPGNVTSIGNYAFANMALTTVRLEDGDKDVAVGTYIFSESPITTVYLGRTIAYASVVSASSYYTTALYLPFNYKQTIKSLTIGDKVKSIPAYLFYEDNTITSLSMGSKVEQIGAYAFYDCYGYTALALPNTLTSIGIYAFYNNNGITSLTFADGGNNGMTLGEYAFRSCSKVTELSIPANVTSIGTYCFGYMSALKKVTMTDGTKNLATSTYIFYNNSNIAEVYLGRNLTVSNTGTNQYYEPFTYITGLKTVTVGDLVTSIPAYLFYNDTGITSLTLGSALQTIGTYAFYNNSKLTELSLPGTITNINDYAFSSCSSLKTIEIGNGSGTLTFGNYVFDGTSPTSITVGKNFTCGTMNSSYAPFYGRTTITELKFGTGITEIPTYGFYGCTGITKVSIPANVTSIGNYAFGNCTNLADLTLEDGEEDLAIGTYVFNSNNTAKVYLGRTYIYTGTNDYGPFYGKTTIKTLTIGDNVASIPSYAFNGCSSISCIILPDSLKTLGIYAFNGCSGVTTLKLSESLTAIPSNCFNGCSGLTELSLPARITSLGTNSFNNCSGLICVTSYNPTTYRISSTVFAAVDYNSCELHVPEGTSEDYANQDYWSNFTHIVEMLAPHFWVTNTDGTSSNVFVRNDGTTVTLNDAVLDITVSEEMIAEKFAYVRTFSNTNWQALYIPFSMNYNDWSSQFDVARINNINQYDDNDDGVIDRTVMEVFKIKGGNLEPNTPYLIKARTVGKKTISMSNIAIVQTEEKQYDVSSWNTLFTFTGKYSQVSGSDMLSAGYYALGSGTLHKAETSTSCLSPMRWYMAVTDRDGNPKDVNNVRAIPVWCVDDDTEETGIISFNNEQERASSIYDVSGRMVKSARKGIYFMGGKKVLIK